MNLNLNKLKIFFDKDGAGKPIAAKCKRFWKWFVLIQIFSTKYSNRLLFHASKASGTFGKLKQTLSSSLLTAQDKGK